MAYRRYSKASFRSVQLCKSKTATFASEPFMLSSKNVFKAYLNRFRAIVSLFLRVYLIIQPVFMQLLRWLISCLLILFGQLVFCQPYYFRHYKVENGLSYNSVLCGLQDSKGFVWLGTKAGLNRFDGYSFRESGRVSDSSYPVRDIRSLYEDSRQQLWVGTSKGLFRYNEIEEQFSIDTVSANKAIGTIGEDKNGFLWYIANNALHRYDPGAKTTRIYSVEDYFYVTSLTISPEGILWAGTSGGRVEKYDPVRDAFKSYEVFAGEKQIRSYWITTLKATPDGKLLIGTTMHGARLLDPAKSSIQTIPIYNKALTELYIRDFLCTGENEYWIATESGIFLYHPSDKSYTHLEKDYHNPYSLSDNAIYSLFKDKEGGVWAGTYFGGVNYHAKPQLAFDKYFPSAGSYALSGNIVREICPDKNGNLWIGTEDAGLNKLNLQTRQITYLKPGNATTGLSFSNIHALFVNGKELWIGTYDHGIDVLDLTTEKIIRRYRSGPDSKQLKNNFVVTIKKTGTEGILVGTWAGLFQYHEKTDSFSRINHVPANAHIYAIMEDQEGTVWVATKGSGVYYFNEARNKNGHFRELPGTSNGLGGSMINDIYQDSNQNIWFASEEAGLTRFNPATQSFTHFTTQQGLPSNFIFKLLEDDQKTLWITTSKGLVSMNHDGIITGIYTRSHGLLSDQFNYNSGYKDNNGRLYFGSISGMISFNPAELLNKQIVPPIYITGFQVNNKELLINSHNSALKQSITYTPSITLNHRESSISIDFAALYFTAPEMTEYAYRLKGLDQDWIKLKTNRKVYFTQLKPGRYTFEVKSPGNGSERWETIPATLDITILPPFYASTWAYLTYAILIISGIMLVIRRYHLRTQKKNNEKIEHLKKEKEKEVYQAKIDFFTNITHEIRTPLTLIQAPLEKVMKASDLGEVRQYTGIIEKNTQQLSGLINQLLDFRKTETNVYQLNFVRSPVSKLVKDSCHAFSGMAIQRNLSFQISLPEKPLYAYIDQSSFNKILTNLLNNATKYAAEYVEVVLHPVDNGSEYFIIEIKNDGHIIQPMHREMIFQPFFRIKETNSETGTGIGLPLARSLAELHEGSLKLVESKGDLNIFELKLPLRHKIEFKLDDDAEFSDQQETADAAIKTDPEKTSLLIVDDQPDILQFLAKDLGQTYTILKASNAREAIGILESNVVHLVISDVMMPEMDGFELCSWIKSKLEYCHVPVVLLTARNSLQAKIEGLELGADAYIEKPFSPEHLAVQVANLLSNRQKIKEFFATSPLLHIKTIAYTKEDENFLEKITAIIEENMSNPFDTEMLANSLFMSRASLFRKIKAISDLTPNELINLTRLKKAAEYLATGNYKIYEVAHMIGFNSQSNFTRLFQKQFGMTPSEYLQQKQEEQKQNE